MSSQRAQWLFASGLLCCSMPLAWAGVSLDAGFPDQPEKAVAMVGLLFGCCLLGPIGAYVAVRRRDARPGAAAFIVLLSFVTVTLAAFLIWVSSLATFRADTLLWSESPFVSDIIKLRAGTPIYSVPADLNSYFYTPGSQLLTYLMASLVGKPTSIPIYRIIQLLFVAAAAVTMTACALRLRRLTGWGPTLSLPWAVLWFPILFLVGVNDLTNPYTFLIHNDGLGLLIASLGYMLLLRYVKSRSLPALALMALLPVIGFCVKQSLAIWAGLYLIYLAFFDRPRSVNRVVGFSVVAFGLLGLVPWLGVQILGEEFWNWTITGLGAHAVSPFRSFQHFLDSWYYWIIGLAGGLLVLRRRNDAPMIGLWVVWLTFFFVESYTSGFSWMRNHMGPGSLLATTWMCAALPTIWPPARPGPWSPRMWARTAGFTVIAGFAIVGLHVIREPRPALSPDANRYAAAIEREFLGVPAERVLLDNGSWVYLKGGIVMKDRSSVAGESGWSGIADFSGMIERIRSQYYQRIIVRDLDGPEFMYDYAAWKVSSGVRQAIKQHYQVVRIVPGVEGSERISATGVWLRSFSVLEPRIP